MMIHVYRFFYGLGQLFICAAYPLLSKNLQKWIDLREQTSQHLQNQSPIQNVVWFHAASGEIEYCKSVIRELKKVQPELSIIVTYTSPSAEKLFQNIAAEVTAFVPLCWDLQAAVQKMLRTYKPQLLLFSRTDLWPELITQAHQMNIPMGIIAYNPRFHLLKDLFKNSLLKKMSFISCVSEATALQLKKNIPAGPEITADGDTRFDQVFHRLSETSKIQIQSTQKILTLGSTWPADENVFWPLLQKLKDQSFQIILSPHHVDTKNITRLTTELQKLNLKTQLLSENLPDTNLVFKTDVLIVDRIGYLADCYRFSDVAFVGGSFKDKVHSVMEALCCGLNVFVGPFYQNNPEAVQYMNKYVHLLPANDSNRALDEILKKSSNNKNEIKNKMLENKNASARISAHLLHKLLKKVNS